MNQTVSSLKLLETGRDLQIDRDVETLGEQSDLPLFLEERQQEIESKLTPLEEM